MKILAEFLHKFYIGQVTSKPKFLYWMRYFLSLGCMGALQHVSRSRKPFNNEIEDIDSFLGLFWSQKSPFALRYIRKTLLTLLFGA